MTWLAAGVGPLQFCPAHHVGFLSLQVAGVGLVQQLRGGFVVLKRILDAVPVEWNSSDVIGPLHRLLLLHGLPIDLVVDRQHDDDGEPECQGGRDESVGNVGDEGADLVPGVSPVLDVFLCGVPTQKYRHEGDGCRTQPGRRNHPHGRVGVHKVVVVEGLHDGEEPVEGDGAEVEGADCGGVHVDGVPQVTDCRPEDPPSRVTQSITELINYLVYKL